MSKYYLLTLVGIAYIVFITLAMFGIETPINEQYYTSIVYMMLCIPGITAGTYALINIFGKATAVQCLRNKFATSTMLHAYALFVLVLSILGYRTHSWTNMVLAGVLFLLVQYLLIYTDVIVYNVEDASQVVIYRIRSKGFMGNVDINWNNTHKASTNGKVYYQVSAHLNPINGEKSYAKTCIMDVFPNGRSVYIVDQLN